MSAKHTPGPWQVANGIQIRSERDQIAKVWMMRSGEGTANARLIAAAPDLLEALADLKHNGHLISFPHSSEHEKAVIRKALDALAKAAGETA